MGWIAQFSLTMQGAGCTSYRGRMKTMDLIRNVRKAEQWELLSEIEKVYKE
jgi:hypothetical protein